MTIAANFESHLGVNYNPLTGAMEVRINKPTQPLTLFEVKKVSGANTAARPQTKSEWPIFGFDLEYEYPEMGLTNQLFDNDLYAIRYVPRDTLPIIFRTQYDVSDGLLASFFFQSSQENSGEVGVNYRQSDSNLAIEAKYLDQMLKLDGKITGKSFAGQIKQNNFLPVEMDQVELKISDEASDAQNTNGHYRPEIIIGKLFEIFICNSDREYFKSCKKALESNLTEIRHFQRF